jgi:ring-1,2-phenylacetyl-CoA epoxidase subunit PaaC
MHNTSINELLHVADNALILGHRNSEWCGHGPVLEQDIAISNIALDLLGLARNVYQHAANVFNTLPQEEKLPMFSSPLIQEKIVLQKVIDEDDFAYLRDQQDYKNFLLLEFPKGDWGYTTLRLFLFSSYQKILFNNIINNKHHEILQAIAAKSLKEVVYHIQWSADWVLRLGDGTGESHKRIQDSLNDCWHYGTEFFKEDPDLREQWIYTVSKVLQEATLTIPETNKIIVNNGPKGLHTEHLSYLLAEMQSVHRAYPNSTW